MKEATVTSREVIMNVTSNCPHCGEENYTELCENASTLESIETRCMYINCNGEFKIDLK